MLFVLQKKKPPVGGGGAADAARGLRFALGDGTPQRLPVFHPKAVKIFNCAAGKRGIEKYIVKFTLYVPAFYLKLGKSGTSPLYGTVGKGDSFALSSNCVINPKLLIVVILLNSKKV